MCLFQTQLQQNQSKLSPNPDAGNAASSNGQNAVKLEQKPVECNLCHRKFKNIPALNGHMRLHGGYFKKDAEPKKCDKKESAGPPLQTASIGIRALIEEKIISKRGKDIKVSMIYDVCIFKTEWKYKRYLIKFIKILNKLFSEWICCACSPFNRSSIRRFG